MSPNAHSTLKKSKRSDLYYVETVLSSESFDDLRAWWYANEDKMRAAGAKLGGWARGQGVTVSRMFKSIDYSPSWTYTDIRHEMRIFYPVADQDAAENVHKRVLWGSYASSRNNAYREDIKSLTALAA